MQDIKQQLYDQCSQHLATQAAVIKSAIAEIRDAAASETKSSAGDKYETGREMMQQEIDLNNIRLLEINKLQIALSSILPANKYTTAQPGALVRTSNGRYFIAISAGKLSVNGNTYYAISPASPLGSLLAGRKAGDTFSLNEKAFVIEEIS